MRQLKKRIDHLEKQAALASVVVVLVREGETVAQAAARQGVPGARAVIPVIDEFPEDHHRG